MSVPNGWNVVELGRLAVDGPTNGYSPAAAPDAEGTRSLKLSATTQGRLVLNDDTIKFLHERIASDSWAWLEPGDLLVQRSNTAELVGTAAIFDGLPKTYIYPDLMMRLRFADEATTRWVWRYLNSPAGRRFFGVMAAGAAGSMPKISGAKLKAMPIPLPPLPEQRRIAAILDKADGIRRKRREAIALTEDLLRSTFLEMFGDPVTNPNGWPEEPLSSVVQEGTIVTYGIVQAGPPIENGVPYIRTGDIQGGRILVGRLLRTSRDIAANYRRSEVRTGDLVMSIRATVGTVAVVPAELDGANLTQGTARIAPGPRASGPYLLSLIRAPGMQSWIQQRVKGATFKEITLGALRTAPIMLPPVELQKRFAAIAQRITGLQVKTEAFRFASEQAFDSLVHRAFRGEL